MCVCVCVFSLEWVSVLSGVCSYLRLCVFVSVCGVFFVHKFCVCLRLFLYNSVCECY